MARPSTRLTLRVMPGAGRSEVVGRHGSAWKVRIAAAPERGRANAALVRLLAQRLRVSRSEITVVSGHAGRDKIVDVGGLSAEEAAARLLEECERV